MVRRVVDSLKEVVCAHREALAMLISNVTQRDAGAHKLLQINDDPELHGPPPERERVTGTASAGRIGGGLNARAFPLLM